MPWRLTRRGVRLRLQVVTAETVRARGRRHGGGKMTVVYRYGWQRAKARVGPSLSPTRWSRGRWLQGQWREEWEVVRRLQVELRGVGDVSASVSASMAAMVGPFQTEERGLPPLLLSGRIGARK
jgi:hypothetical protein